jgi:hypothetical protein
MGALGMDRSPERRRRWLGVVLLGTAGLMLVTGLTVLAPRLRGLTFVGYWLGCMGLTFLAALTALLDLWATARRVRQAQHELLSQAISQVARARPGASGPSPSSGLSKPAADASITAVSDRKPRSP